MAIKRVALGRPLTGIREGEKASQYPRMTMRLPPDSMAELDAAARATGLPQWRVLVEALNAYYRKGPALDDDQLRIAKAILKAAEKSAAERSK